ncbi:MAG: hypothetical protein Q7S32_02430 [bacterium]|nr:hypothetical protein [bacterium]
MIFIAYKKLLAILALALLAGILLWNSQNTQASSLGLSVLAVEESNEDQNIITEPADLDAGFLVTPTPTLTPTPSPSPSPIPGTISDQDNLPPGDDVALSLPSILDFFSIPEAGTNSTGSVNSKPAFKISGDPEPSSAYSFRNTFSPATTRTLYWLSAALALYGVFLSTASSRLSVREN